MGLGYVVTGILYRGLCPDALNDPTCLLVNIQRELLKFKLCSLCEHQIMWEIISNVTKVR